MVPSNISAGPIRVLGIGNVLMSDDGFGPTVARTLTARYAAPDGVEIDDVGTPGADLVPYLCGAAAVILVDTVASAGPPGTLRVFRNQEIVSSPPPDRTSPHQPGIREALMAAELSDQSPGTILLVGVSPASTDQGTVLSPQVDAAVEVAVETVLGELQLLGRTLVSRDDPASPDLWWR